MRCPVLYAVPRLRRQARLLSGDEAGGAGGGGFRFRLHFFGSECDELPGGAVAQQARDEGGVHGVSGALGDDVAEDVVAGQGEVADEVEDLVARELVVEAQIAVEDALAGEHDDAFFGGAADQAHVAEFLFVFAPAKGAGGGDFALVGAGGEVDDVSLAADGRGEVDFVGDGVAIARIDSDELVAFADLDALENAEVFAAAALAFQSDFAKGLGVRKRAAVEDGEFEVVELDVDVVDAGAEQCGEQVLRGGDEDALTHEAGGVADLGDVAADGGDFESVEIGAAEDDAGTGRCGEQAHAHRSAAVKANAGELNWGGNRIFQVG